MYKTTTTPFRKSYTNSLIRHRFVAAYKKPIVEAFFYPSVYICPWQSSRKFNVSLRVKFKKNLFVFSALLLDYE